MKIRTRIILILVAAVLAVPGISRAAETVSVLYFENTSRNRDYEWLSKGIADMVITDIAGRGAIDVIERENLKKVLDEQQLSLTGIIDDKKALEIGKLLSATRLIYGSFIIQGNVVIINGKLTETQSGKITAAFTSQGALTGVLSVKNEFSLKIQKALGIETSGTQKQEQETPFLAIKNYYQGLDLLDKGAVDDARKKFEEASRIDPYYLKPYQGIEESYKYLKDFTRMRHQREIAVLYDRIIRIQARLKETPWRTFADIAMDPRYAKMRQENEARYNREMYAYFQGDTPAICTWNLQNNLFELADLYEEHFGDNGKAAALNKEVLSITEKSRRHFGRDPFFPEILYSGLRASVYFEDWPDVKKRCEELMTGYPDYRMMWAVEDFYKNALEKMSGKKE
jgi:TolB-like protein